MDNSTRLRERARTAHSLKPAAFHVLLALAEGSAHGYALMQAVRARSAGEIALGTASFYRHLARLMDEGLVAETGERPEDDDPRRGAYYRLTPRGMRALAAERSRLASLVAAIDALNPARRGPA